METINSILAFMAENPGIYLGLFIGVIVGIAELIKWSGEQ